MSDNIPEHKHAFKIGHHSVSVLQQVPHMTEVKVVRELENNKVRVTIVPDQGLVVEDIDLFLGKDIAFTPF